jgi:hypothetical protein
MHLLATFFQFKLENLEVSSLHCPPPKPLWNQRVELISGRCYFVLEKQGISRKNIRSFTRAMHKWFCSEKVAPKVSVGGSDYFSPYTRPVSMTIWDERFDLTKSIANQPVTKKFLKMIGSQEQLPDHRFYGYVAALALLEIMDGLMGTRPEELSAFENFGGPHEEGGPDWTAFELEEESNTMIENMLGKAEEFVFKSDALTEQAEFGQKGKRQTEIIKLMVNNNSISNYRHKSGKNVGKINITGLSNYIHTRIGSYGFKPLNKSEIEEEERYCPRQFPTNSKTIARRLPKILARLNIPDK